MSDSTLREASQAIGHSIEPRVYPVVEALGDGEGRSCIRVSFSGDDAPPARASTRTRASDEDVLMSAAFPPRERSPRFSMLGLMVGLDMRLSWRGISRRAGNQMGKA